MRMPRALPLFGADEEGRVREQQLRRTPLRPRRQQAAGMVEVQVREHHHVDVLVPEAGRAQRVEQDVAILLHAVAFAQLRFEERADAGLRSEEHTSELPSLMRISYAVFCLKHNRKPERNEQQVRTQYQ